MEKKPVKKNYRISWQYNAKQERADNVIGARIAKERKNAGLSLVDFSGILREVGVEVSSAAINKWEMGDSVPNPYQLFAVCAVFGIRDAREFFDSTYQEKTPVLNERGRRKVREYEKDLIASGNYKPIVREAKIIQFVDMLVSNLAVSAGTGEFLDEGSFETVQVPKDQVPSGADFGVRVHGDSMEPKYHDGQIAWVQRCESLSPGEVGIFLYDGEGYLKCYEEQEPDEDVANQFLDSEGILHKQPVLVSFNKKYDSKVVSPDVGFQIAGRVLN